MESQTEPDMLATIVVDHHEGALTRFNRSSAKRKKGKDHTCVAAAAVDEAAEVPGLVVALAVLPAGLAGAFFFFASPSNTSSCIGSDCQPVVQISKKRPTTKLSVHAHVHNTEVLLPL